MLSASGKVCNNADGLIRVTIVPEARIFDTTGRFFTLCGLRYGFLVVNKTKAKAMPCHRA